MQEFYYGEGLGEQNRSEESSGKTSKSAFLALFIIIVFAVYALKLFSLQIMQGNAYRRQSRTISTTVTTIPAQRGEIFDRNANLPMVINTDSFSVSLTPGEIPSGLYDTVAMKLAGYLDVSKDAIDRRIPKSQRRSFSSITVKTNVPFEVIINIAENITELPGVSWASKPVRNYVETGSISHILGYVGDITKEELTVMYNDGYTSSSVVGKMGIEKQYDKLLQGTAGREIRTRDARGRILSAAPVIEPPKSGQNLVLTIDNSIQTLAEKALGNRVGAIVVLKPSNGEILAMVSYPFFDPNLFSSDDVGIEYNRLKNAPNNPLLNRAVNATYPPASTFKTIMATAMLNEKIYPAANKIDCAGEIEAGGRVFHCHVKKPGHGWLDLKNALAQSCDVYFWQIGKMLDVDRIASYAGEFGFGQDLNIDLPAQAKGLVPTSQWKERRFHESWRLGDTFNMSIGQGYTLVTPLHLADMVAMVCNSGTVYRPHLLKEIRDPVTNEVVEETQPEVMLSSTVSPEVWQEVQRDLRYVISDGTPQYPMGNKIVKSAGKTGTAEVNGYAKDHWHSWMVAYAPYDAPPEEQVIVVTIVEAVNTWEWWAPYATNIVIQGIFADQTFDEAVDALGFRYLINMYNKKAVGRME
ncbi:MAG TPA: penicillin-binding protein 2 [Treponema sp.]|nr:penicillin-binding protein 2 [Treponema sp.]